MPVRNGAPPTDDPPASGEQARHARALLLERAAAGLAHEGKNPLHTMALHLHLLADKLAKVAPADQAIERHAQALREGIGKVDALLRCFAEMASPAHVEPDLGMAMERALLLFGYELRRAGGSVEEWKGPRRAPVEAPAGALADLGIHSFLVALGLARGGGTVAPELRVADGRAELILVAQGGQGQPEEVAQHLDAVRRLALEAGAELSIAASATGSARLSISLPLAR